MIGSGRGWSGGGRRCSSLGYDDKFERFSVDLKLHFMLIELELDSCVYRNDGLFGGLGLTNGVVSGAGADDILLAQQIDVLLFGFLCATGDRGVRKNVA